MIPGILSLSSVLLSFASGCSSSYWWTYMVQSNPSDELQYYHDYDASIDFIVACIKLASTFTRDLIEIPATWNSVQLIERQRLRAEKYLVTTEDGYVVTLHRIANSSGQPVLLMHGVLASSDQWLVLDRNQSLAYSLADAGFDVWLGDQRGSYYSRAHTTYSTKSENYWNFSFHESAVYDLSAFIRFILTTNRNYKQIYYVGHSMGTTVFFVLCSQRPEFASTVKAAFLLAPVAYGVPRKDWTPGLRIVDQADAITSSLAKQRVYEFLPRNGATMKLVMSACGTKSLTQNICFEMIDQFYGENRKNWDLNKIGYYISSVPTGTSLKTAHHLSQIFKTGKFRQYDYGPSMNKKIYGTDYPPKYNLSQVKTKVALYQGLHDRLTTVETVHKIAKRLPNLIKNHVIPDLRFGHVDFMFGLNAKTLVYDDIIRLMRKISRTPDYNENYG